MNKQLKMFSWHVNHCFKKQYSFSFLYTTVLTFPNQFWPKTGNLNITYFHGEKASKHCHQCGSHNDINTYYVVGIGQLSFDDPANSCDNWAYSLENVTTVLKNVPKLLRKNICNNLPSHALEALEITYKVRVV